MKSVFFLNCFTVEEEAKRLTQNVSEQLPASYITTQKRKIS
jgi:hypothetical protein